MRCILRDEQGFVWIGTKSGLGKFDGHELKRYKHQANDPNSLLHNLIYQIAEDKQHNIWVLTEKGIARYQQQSNDFTFPTDEDGKNITAYSFCLVPDGILFGGKDRIYKYSMTILLSGFCNISTPTLLKSTLSVCGIQRRCSVAAVGQAYTS